MIKNYFKVAWRSIVRNKTYSYINITGLTVSLTCVILISLWVSDELSYDKFHTNKENLYRITIVLPDGKFLAVTPGKLAPALKLGVPGVQDAARILTNQSKNSFRYKGKIYYEKRYATVDASFFRMFNFPFNEGNKETVFSNPDEIVITKQIADKYFGKEEAIGKSFNYDNKANYQVSGVLQNIPHNTIFQYDIFDSHIMLEKYWPNGYTWTNFSHATYIQLEKNAVVKDIAEDIKRLLLSNIPDSQIKAQIMGVYLQPVGDIYLNAEIDVASGVHGNIFNVYIFAAIALGILFIGCLNFINISTAQATTRLKEVGLRKVIGASKNRLILQFFSETFLITLFCVSLSFFLLELTLPFFNTLSSKNLSLNYSNIYFIPGIILLTIITTLISGSYPAFYLSGFHPIQILKGIHKSKGNSSFRRAMVVIQFTFAVALIFCTIVIYYQFNFIKNKNLNFEKENVIYIPSKGSFSKNYNFIKNALLQNPDITGVTLKDAPPLNSIQSDYVTYDGQTRENLPIKNTKVEYDFFDVLGLKFTAGRAFLKEYATDSKEAFIINEEAVKTLELKDPVGKQIETMGKKGEIIGVVKNAYFQSLHQNIEPMVFDFLENKDNIVLDLFGTVILKVKGENIPSTLEFIENLWKTENPGYPFEYYFLDKEIDSQYKSDAQFGKIIQLFTGLTVFIAMLGMFGLALFSVNRRTKEIGIRKVVGASVQGILILLVKDFIKWILYANLIAWPLAYFLIDKWLQNFVYRVEISWWMFAISGSVGLFIALLAIGFHSLKAATSNPVESLRYE